MSSVAVAMSGGVDSSVAAALLVEEGRDVFGVTMRLGLAEIAGRTCCGEEEVLLAARVCSTLGIPHVVIDMAEEFEAAVVEPFCAAYASGLTPNPCVRCNERLKLGAFVGRVRQLGADVVATGHYARVVHEHSVPWLERASDRTKDQSYFLYRVSPDVLGLLELPLGGLRKEEVRRMAEERCLPTASRPESQEVCFTSDYAGLVASRFPEAARPGPIEHATGAVLGTHRGIAHYTVGQRRGLGVGGPGGPYTVLAIDAVRNTVIVGSEPALEHVGVTLLDAVWRLEGTAAVGAQVRYRAREVAAQVAPNDECALDVRFEHPVQGLAPGQSVVFYRGRRVVGGGIIPAST